MTSQNNKILFVDERATNNASGGGSSKSLRILLKEFNEKEQKEKLYFLSNDFNDKYIEKNIPKSINRLHIKYPDVLNKYGGSIFNILNVINLLFYAIPKVNIQLYREIKKEEISTVVYNENRAFLTYLFLNLYLKFFTDIQTIKYIRGEPDKNSKLDNLSNKTATKLIVLADYIKNLLDKKFHNKTYILVNGVPYEELSSQKENKLNKNSKYINILNVGTITRGKGQKDLVLAFLRLKKIYKKQRIKIYFLGDCNDKKYFEEIQVIIRENNLMEDIFFLGFKKNVNYYYNCSDIIVHPSYSEGVPRIVLESSVFNNIIVASDIPGNLEIIEDGINGYIFKKGDIDDLVDKIMLTLDMSTSQKKKMWEKASNQIENNFDVKYKNKELMEIINK